MYARDFPKIEDLQSPAGTVTHNIQASPAVSNATELQVTVESVVTNEDDYNVRLAKWNKDVADHESHIISNYVNTHVHIVVDDLRDVDKIKKKMQRIPVLSDKKRKLFISDDAQTRPVDWEKVKRMKKSVFHPMVFDFEADSVLDPVFEVYHACRTEHEDGMSDDLIACIVPGPPPNSPSNKSVEACYKKLKTLVPKHQSPKIGTIVPSSQDVFRRVKARGAWQGRSDDNIMFTSQRRGLMQRKAMSFLAGGDTYFNRWPVPSIPFTQLCKCDVDTHDKLFTDGLANVATFHEDGDTPRCDMLADEAAMPDNSLIPFPNEHPVLLGQELINVFDVQCLIDFNPASGNRAKAAMLCVSADAWPQDSCLEA